MNQHFQTILNLIQQDESLPVKEKNRISKSLNEADKEFEAKNYELEIESSLERVRTVALRMSKPDDLLNICEILFNELKALGFSELRNALIHTFVDEDNYFNDYDYSDFTGGCISRIPYSGNAVIERFIKVIRKANDAFIEIKISGRELEKWKAFRKSNGEADDARLDNIDSLYYYIYSVGAAAIGISTYHGVSIEKQNVLRRFRNAFNLAYKRYIDITQAEAQAREAQIEAALERVRAKTMAMHKSEQLAETAKVFFEQFDLLGKIPDRMSIGIINEESKKVELWVTDQMGNQVNNEYFFSIDEPTSMAKIYAAWKERKDTFVVDLIGKNLKEWLRFVKEEAKLPIDETKIKGRRVQQAAFFSGGFLLFTTHEPVADEIMQLLVRFARVFDLTYTRFLDLQKAEAQTREAKIEAALERVRSKAMAMQKSDDLANAVAIVFEELGKLNPGTMRCGIGIINKEKRSVNVWATAKSDEHGPIQISGDQSMDSHPLLRGAFNAWLKQEDYSYLLQGEDLNNYYKTQASVNFKLPESQSANQGLSQYYFLATFQAGGLFAFRETPFPDEAKIVIKRFADVFNLTYTRFNDIKKAEAQAREAIKRSSLDRVRAETASMRTTGDLEKITPLIWNELTTLGVPFIRCGVFIMDEQQEQIHSFLSTPDGKAIAAFELPYDSAGELSKVLVHWHKKEMYKDHWDEATFAAWTKSLMQQGAIASEEKYSTAHRPVNLDLHFLPFLQGMLYVGSETPLNDEEIHLVQSLANAFSTAYARYEDFNKLESAKAQIEKTLVDLKQAQAQLIQSEKMASLGELTAGIAHEIQNPLNFVNNFSDVNQELLVEIKDEMKKGNIEEADLIVNDVIENEQKINHHGKRADAIVKGMLQHSRKSSGQKEPTDINALADEYLRLSYHGLRAKDKTFNATMKTDFDETIGKVNVIPQEIGRVLLNLFNNAFYAASLPSKGGFKEQEPTILVSTKKINGNLEISVKDNGNGIPQKILDKILQPFFTTKPTGEGTGLGLSLAYDIIKAHGGTLKVETKEGEGSEFIVQLPVA
jgi:signal transduction histidine kinase